MRAGRAHRGASVTSTTPGAGSAGPSVAREAAFASWPSARLTTAAASCTSRMGLRMMTLMSDEYEAAAMVQSTSRTTAGRTFRRVLTVVLLLFTPVPIYRVYAPNGRSLDTMEGPDTRLAARR